MSDAWRRVQLFGATSVSLSLATVVVVIVIVTVTVMVLVLFHGVGIDDRGGTDY